MEAAGTSVLSRRWRRVWTFLPELTLDFRSMPDGSVAAAIAAHSVDIRRLAVSIHDAAPGPGSMPALLSAAARRVSGVLDLYNLTRAKATAQGAAAAFELPCFDRATALYLDLGRLRVSIAPAGVFSRLVEIFLRRVRFAGDPCELGAAVSSPRCPCLVRLTVHDAYGVGNLTIHSESLLELELKRLCGSLRRLAVVAPALEDLTVVNCFFWQQNHQPVADISACHRLLSLEWKDLFDASTVQLGEMEHLQWLGTSIYKVYGDNGFLEPNRSCLNLLQWFKFRVIPSLCLTLLTLPDIST